MSEGKAWLSTLILSKRLRPWSPSASPPSHLQGEGLNPRGQDLHRKARVLNDNDFLSSGLLSWFSVIQPIFPGQFGGPLFLFQALWAVSIQ